MTIAFAIFIIVGVACSIASVYFSIRTIQDTKKIIDMPAYLSRHDRFIIDTLVADRIPETYQTL